MEGASKRLKQLNFKLNLLLNVTQAISQNQSIDNLLEKYQDILVNDLGIGQILIIKNNGTTWEYILNYSFSQLTNNVTLDIEKDLLPLTEITFVTSSPNPALQYFDIVIPVIINNKPMAFVLIGDILEEQEGVSPTIKHLHFIQTLSNIVITAVENLRLVEQNIKQAVYKREMELAQKMQSMLIPSDDLLPKNEHIHIKAFYKPHMEIGGDYYDFIQLEDNIISFCVADVSGKGISAALLMSNFQANLRALINSKISLADIAGILNHRVTINTKGDRFITLFLARYNYTTHELEYINAGHNPPILFEMETNRLSFLNKGCTAMGMLEEIPIIKRGIIPITQHSKLLCFTDGIVELLGDKGIELGTKSLENELTNTKSIEENIHDIIKNYQVLEKANSIFDDITLLGIEFY